MTLPLRLLLIGLIVSLSGCALFRSESAPASRPAAKRPTAARPTTARTSTTRPATSRPTANRTSAAAKRPTTGAPATSGTAKANPPVRTESPEYAGSSTAKPASAPANRPATASASVKKDAPSGYGNIKGKVVDTRTYQRQYVREVVAVARSYVGTPYVSGGNTGDGMDCSGLIYNAFMSTGLRMPRISWQQAEVGPEVDLADIQPGDLVFFVPENATAGYVSHAGIITDVRGPEDIRFIHASTSRGVREDNLFSTYFKGRFVKALRPF